eukprot:1849371-Amphidinium_carterae.1
MEIKVAYKQIHRTVIENKGDYKQNHFHDYSIITTNANLDDYAVKMTIEIFQNSQKKYEVNNSPTQNRFFVFLLQHYRERFQNICQRAGVTVEDYNQILEYFDKRGGSRFNRPNRRDLHETRSMHPTQEERDQALHYIRRLPEMTQPPYKTSSIAEEENTYDKESTTRTSTGTSLKRKSELDDKEAKKMTTGAHTVIIINNPTIHHFGASQSSTTSTWTPPENKEGQTPRAT